MHIVHIHIQNGIHRDMRVQGVLLDHLLLIKHILPVVVALLIVGDVGDRLHSLKVPTIRTLHLGGLVAIKPTYSLGGMKLGSPLPQLRHIIARVVPKAFIYSLLMTLISWKSFLIDLLKLSISSFRLLPFSPMYSTFYYS